MSLSRRSVLAVLAASAAAPGLAACAGPDAAAAWRDPGAAETDLRRYALAHAILAPNPHNRQPWLVELAGQDEIVFFADLDRLLPQTDPFDRQIAIGCGAFLELLGLALNNRGHRAEITLFPDGEPQPRLSRSPIAHIRVAAGAEKDALFDQIGARRTSREPFEAREPAQTELDAIAQAAAAAPLTIQSARGGALRDQLRRLAWDAFEREFQTPAAHQETVNLIRVGNSEISEHRDGIALRGVMVEIGRFLNLVNKDTLADVNNSQTRDGLMAWRPLALEAPAFMWLNAPDNTRTTQIAAGRAYARMNLAAAARGLSMQPWSQALQEYPQMAQLHAQAEELMKAPGDARVQMLARIGYGPQVQPAPRRGLDEHIKA